MNLSPTLAERLTKLKRLGAQVDQAAADWLRASVPDDSAPALTTMAEARRMIELTVDLAVSEGVAQSSVLTEMRAEWESRFARLAAMVQARQQALLAESQLRVQQNHAAQAYLRHA